MTQENTMPIKTPEMDDPMTLTGVCVPGGVGAAEDMAYTFAEEFARLGHTEEQLMEIFRSRSYRAPHDAYRILGEDMIHGIVCECAEVWGGFRSSDDDGRSCRGGQNETGS